MSEREQFEAWAKARYAKNPHFWLRQIDDGGYSCGMADSAWDAWQAARAQPAQAVPMTDQEILDAAEAIKAKRVETAVKNTLSRVGSKCSQCGGVMGTDHNGYHLFNRCKSCSYVPMFMQDGSEFPPPPGIVGKEGA